MDIEDWRDEIDRVDEKLVDLLNRRAQCAIEIGRIKRERGLPVYSPERERDVIRHVADIASGPLEAAAVRRLFERIIDESRSLERLTVEQETAQKSKVRGKNESGTSSKRKARNRA